MDFLQSLVAAPNVMMVAVLFALPIYLILTYPLRWRERTRLLLWIIEAGISRGKSPEHAICDLPRARLAVWRQIVRAILFLYTIGIVWFFCRKAETSEHFPRLARQIEKGHSLTEALRRVPGFVPVQVIETLAVGERLGDIGKVLPACRQVVDVQRSRIRAAQSYFVLVFAGGFVAVPAVFAVVAGYVFPQFEMMFMEMDVSLPPLARFIIEYSNIFFVTTAVGLFLLVAIIFYCRGLTLKSGFPFKYPGAVVSYLLPWCRMRIQRDFSAMLTTLLDAGIPETEAVAMAAQSTANWVMIQRAETAAELMERGVSLVDAIGRIDGGEFRWRLANAVHADGGFREALAGWHDALTCKAEQGEQAAAHLVTTGLLLVNGLMVGVCSIGIFQCLTSMMEAGCLW